MKLKAAQWSVEGERNWISDQVYRGLQHGALSLSVFSCMSCGPSHTATSILSLCQSPSPLVSVPLDPEEMTSLHPCCLTGAFRKVKSVERVWKVYFVFCNSDNMLGVFFTIWLFSLQRHTEGCDVPRHQNKGKAWQATHSHSPKRL